MNISSIQSKKNAYIQELHPFGRGKKFLKMVKYLGELTHLVIRQNII
jgi:hypothetical protein